MFLAIGSISDALTAGMPGYYVREPSPDLYVPLSTEAEEVRHIIKRPCIHRTPVGYRREFLDAYVPNETRYLPEHMLAQLHLMGRLPDHDEPAGSYARKILNRLLIDLSWASSRLEGNTYSLLETQKLIEAGEVAPGKDTTETRMILNHKAAIEMLVASAEEMDVNRCTLFDLHGLLAEGLLDSVNDAGKLRNSIVGIGGSVYSPPVPELIDESFCMLLDKAAAIEDPFEQSFFLMVHLPYLQPFIDVNKRASRLAANIPLIKKNCVPLSLIAVPEDSYKDGVLAVYELNRIELLRDVYMWAYERSCKRYGNKQDSLPKPERFWIQYRDARITVVQHIVLNKLEPDPTRIRELARPFVEEVDMDWFVDMLMQELQGLHEGILARFQLWPPEFQAWKQLYPGVSDSKEIFCSRCDGDTRSITCRPFR